MEEKTLEDLQVVCRRIKAMLLKKHPQEMITVPAQNLSLMCQVVLMKDPKDIEKKEEKKTTLLPLTEVQDKVLRTIIKLTERDGYSPPVRKVADEMGYKSHASATSALRGLIRKGYVTKSPVDGIIQVLHRPNDGIIGVEEDNR